MIDLSEAQEQLICSVLADADEFGIGAVDTVESVAFFLEETGVDHPTAVAIAREVVAVALH